MKRAAGENYLLLGDAFTFIDPVFSTGVLFAMHSGFVGADTVDTCLAEPHKASRALKAFDASMHRGPKVFSWFIYRLTTPAFRDLFMRPRNRKLEEAVLSVLAGDVFGNTPFGLRLFMFKTLYYGATLLHPVRALFAWKRRRFAVQDNS